MKLQLKLLLALCAMTLAACSDSGVDDAAEKQQTTGTVSKPTEYIRFTDDEVVAEADDETVIVGIQTNVDDGKIKFLCENNGLFVVQDATQGSYNVSRAVSDRLYYKVSINKNESTLARSARLVAVSSSNEDVSDTLTVVQKGTADGTAGGDTEDGKTETLQTHSQGDGIPIVLMGDGFDKAAIANGTYLEVMNKAMENLFSEEPMTSLRSYFDVYVVYVVSKSGYVGKNTDTALGTYVAGNGTSEVSGDDDTVMAYAEKAVSDVNSAHIGVILNCNEYAGTTVFYLPDERGTEELSISYCPIIVGLESEYFRAVFVHELVGHGIGKLADEYSYEENGAIPSSEQKELEDGQNYGYFVNVSTSQTVTPWDDFIDDSYYLTTEEGIGAYLGGYTYVEGVWRPTEKSMMNGNDWPFNAPSRKRLVETIRKRAGEEAYTYEEFKEWDKLHQPDYDRYKTTGETSRSVLGTARRHFAPPVLKKRGE